MWRQMTLTAVQRSFNQITVSLTSPLSFSDRHAHCLPLSQLLHLTQGQYCACPVVSAAVVLQVSTIVPPVQVDGDTSTNDCVVALASGQSSAPLIDSLDSPAGQQLQAAMDAVRAAI